MSRTERVIGGTTISYLHQAAVVLLGLWLTPFLLRRVGQHGYGLWLVAGQLLGYLTLLDLGVIAILPREIAFASGRPDRQAADELIASLVMQVRRIVRWQLPLLVLACAIVWLFLPTAWESLRWPLALVFVAFVAMYPLRILAAVLQGLQDLPFLARTQLVGWALGTIVTIAFVVAGAGIFALVGGWIVTVGFPAVAAWWRVRRLLPSLSTSTSPPQIRQYFERSIWVSVAQVAQVLLAGSDLLLLGQILGPSAVVPYACTGKLVTVFANHPQLLMHAAQPALTELRASQSKARLASVATALTQAMLMMSGALVVVILPANHYFVNWWVGPAQYSGWLMTVALTGMMLLRHWNVSTVYTLFCFGYERQLSLTSLADGIVTVAATVLCVHMWGPVGAPLASIIGVVTVSLPVNVRSVAHEMGLTVRAFVGSIAPLFIRIAATGVAAAVASTWLIEQTLVGVMLLLLSTTALYAAMVLPLALNGPVGPYLRMALPIFGRSAAAPEVEPQAATR
jgi:O-antigen/teichoic acid export membrane protein